MKNVYQGQYILGERVRRKYTQLSQSLNNRLMHHHFTVSRQNCNFYTSTTENIHYSNLPPLTIEKSKEYLLQKIPYDRTDSTEQRNIQKLTHFFIKVDRVWVILSPNILIGKSNLPKTLRLSDFFNMTSAISSDLIFCLFSE